MVVSREVDALNRDVRIILDGNMSPGTPQKIINSSQAISNRATPNQLTVPEVSNLAEQPLNWGDDDQPELIQAKKKTENIEKDVLSSNKIKSDISTENQNAVEGDFSQNNSNFGQNSLQNSKDGQSDDPKDQKQTKRGSMQTPAKNKEILTINDSHPPFPTISIVSPQGEKRTASIDKEGESEYEQEKTSETNYSEEYSNDKFIEEKDLQSGESSVNLSDKDSDEDSVSGDQRRALLELERQQEEIAKSELLPFENNIKSRLYQLNQELANEEPQKFDRTTKVAFREDLVQVISPTEDPQDTNIVRTNKGLKETKDENLDEEFEPQKDVSDSSLETVFDMVVERDGHFDLVTPEDMTASAGDANKRGQSSENEKIRILRSRSRPSSAITARSTSPTLRIPQNRPISCPVYHSPYGLTPKQKELARKQMALHEQVMREEEETKKIKEKEKKMLNEHAFQCWLRRIQENEQATRKKEELQKNTQKKDKEDKENEQKKRNEEMFHKWVQSKYEQRKQEELLKCHEDEERNSFMQPRSQEENDRAYRRWLKRKSQETRRQKFLAKQKYRLQQRLLRRSRLLRNMTWDVYLNNSFRFTDHYGLG